MDWRQEDNENLLYDEEKMKENEMPEVDEVPDLDHLIGIEVVLPQNGTTMQAGKVIRIL